MDKMHQFGKHVTWIGGLIIAGVLLLFNLIYNASVEYSASEIVTIEKTSPIYAVIAVLMGIFIAGILKYLERVDEKALFRFFMIAYLIAGAYWILNISTTLRADAAHINNAAIFAAQGNFSFLELGQDIRNHPWQLGMITYERVLGLFSRNTQLLFLVNLLEIIGINYLTYQLADMVFEHNHRTNVLTIVLSFGFLPQFFFLAFAYGLIPGFLCMLCGFYFQQRYFREAKLRYAVASVIMAVLAVMLKGNSMVGVITMAILFIMQLLKEKKVRYLWLALALMIASQIPGPALIAAYEWESGYELNSGEPKTLYIAMGIMPENRGMAPGWYNAYNDYTYGQAGFDPDVAGEMAMDSIKGSIVHYIEDPADAVDFFSGKIASVWCEPMYQSLWSGPLTDLNQLVSGRVLESLYHGGMLENMVSIYMKAFVILLLALVVGYVFCRKTESYAIGYALIYMIGGFLLHLMWEGKSQYVYTYIFILIPVGARALAMLSEQMAQRMADRGAGRNIHERN